MTARSCSSRSCSRGPARRRRRRHPRPGRRDRAPRCRTHAAAGRRSRRARRSRRRRAAAAAEAPEYRGDPAKRSIRRTVGTGKTFLVVSESPRRDARSAATSSPPAATRSTPRSRIAFALAVAHPTAGNIGGGGFAVVRTGPGKAVALDFREIAPAAATPDMYLDKDGKPTDASLHGDRAVGRAGLGRRAVGAAPEARQEAVEGPRRARDRARARWLRVDASSCTTSIARRTRAAREVAGAARRLWLPGGTPRATGDGRQPRARRDARADRRARRRRLLQGRDRGGDRRRDEGGRRHHHRRGSRGATSAMWRDPLRFTYRGYTVASMPPPSSGGIVLAMTAGMLRQARARQARRGTAPSTSTGSSRSGAARSPRATSCSAIRRSSRTCRSRS